MKTITTKQADLYISDDVYTRGSIFSNVDTEIYYKDNIEILFENPDFDKIKKYTDLYGKVNRLERYAILDAHGNTNGRWIYKDGKKIEYVQRWINSVDGNYSGLILNVCNPGAHTPKTKKSLLILPFIEVRKEEDLLSVFDVEGQGNLFNILISCPGSSDIILPKGKEITGYSIDYELNKLKEKLKEKPAK